MCTFGLSGSERAHFRTPTRQTPPQFHEKTPRETQKERNGGGRGEKKKRNFGPPTLWGPTLCGPTLPNHTLRSPTGQQKQHRIQTKNNSFVCSVLCFFLCFSFVFPNRPPPDLQAKVGRYRPNLVWPKLVLATDSLATLGQTPWPKFVCGIAHPEKVGFDAGKLEGLAERAMPAMGPLWERNKACSCSARRSIR